jgi:hypothetical protein
LLENEDVARDVVERSKVDIQNLGWDTAGFRLKKVYESMLGYGQVENENENEQITAISLK